MKILIVLSIILGVILLFFVIPTMLISNVIFSVLFIRKDKEKWSRNCSFEDEEQQSMFNLGKEWGEKNENFRKTLYIKNGKFNLVGEYFDFGYDKAVIIIPGRMETSVYSYYFSEPYKQLNYNILAIDNRSHGLSDGKYNTIGLKEYTDIIAWTKHLETLGVKQVLYHALCIGSATALYALTSKNSSKIASGIIAEGMYETFGKSLKNHLIERNKPTFPYNSQILFMLKLVSDKNPEKFSPINEIVKLKKPILFIYGKQDAYSTPDQANKLYEKCNSKKSIVWFEKGVHSHLRINNTENYDNAIKNFVLKDINE